MAHWEVGTLVQPYHSVHGGVLILPHYPVQMALWKWCPCSATSVHCGSHIALCRWLPESGTLSCSHISLWHQDTISRNNYVLIPYQYVIHGIWPVLQCSKADWSGLKFLQSLAHGAHYGDNSTVIVHSAIFLSAMDENRPPETMIIQLWCRLAHGAHNGSQIKVGVVHWFQAAGCWVLFFFLWG